MVTCLAVAQHSDGLRLLSNESSGRTGQPDLALKVGLGVTSGQAAVGGHKRELHLETICKRQRVVLKGLEVESSEGTGGIPLGLGLPGGVPASRERSIQLVEVKHIAQLHESG